MIDDERRRIYLIICSHHSHTFAQGNQCVCDINILANCYLTSLFSMVRSALISDRVCNIKLSGLPSSVKRIFSTFVHTEEMVDHSSLRTPLREYKSTVCFKEI